MICATHQRVVNRCPSCRESDELPVLTTRAYLDLVEVLARRFGRGVSRAGGAVGRLAEGQTVTAKPAPDFYAPPIEAIEDRTPNTITPTETSYSLGWATDRDVEWLAAGRVTETMKERAKTLLMWKARYWQGMDPIAAEGAQELYCELIAYGLEP